MNKLESKILIRVVKYRDDIIFGKYSDYTSALNDGTLLWESIIKDNNLSNTEKKLLLKEVKKAKKSAKKEEAAPEVEVKAEEKAEVVEEASEETPEA